MNEKFTLRAVIRFLWKKGLGPKATTDEICAVEGDGIVSLKTVKNWFKRFNDGNMSLDDQPRSGRPTMVDSDVVRQAVEANPCTSTRRLSIDLRTSNATIHRKLKELGKVNRRCKVVPHYLTSEQAQKRLDVCNQLLNEGLNGRQVRRIVACDEKWIFFRNPNTTNQWLTVDALPKPVVKQGRFEQKVMLCVWWNFEGVVHFELVPDGRAIDANLYSEQLERMFDVLSRKYPALVNRQRVILQQDNAPAHKARITREKIEALGGIELMPHPAYSPDLAPSDYHLFRSMAHFLRGKIFADLKEVEAGVREFFDSKPPEWYQAGIENLAKRWEMTIKHKGLYFED